MSGPPKRSYSHQYGVRLKDVASSVLHEGVVTAESPRRAIDVYFKERKRAVTCAMKYSTWQELLRAVNTQWGCYTLCEVSQVNGVRRNYYIIFTQPIV